jgi:hypothetical protein
LQQDPRYQKGNIGESKWKVSCSEGALLLEDLCIQVGGERNGDRVDRRMLGGGRGEGRGRGRGRGEAEEEAEAKTGVGDLGWRGRGRS